jgi:hypothetical protein
MVQRREFNSYKITTEEKTSARREGYNELNFKVSKYFEDKSYLPMMIALIQPSSTIDIVRIVMTDGTTYRLDNQLGAEVIGTLQTLCGLLD